MGGSQMKALKVLNRINAAVLALYIPYILLFWNDFFFAKDKDSLLAGLAGVVFLVTFICSAAVFTAANRKNVSNSLNPAEIKHLDKGTLVYVIAMFVSGAVLIAVFIHSEAAAVYIAFSALASIFVVVQKIIIRHIGKSTCFKIALPWYLFALPFAVFVCGCLAAAFCISDEEMQGRVMTGLFIAAGVLLACLAWHSFFVADETAKTIVKDKGILSVLGAKKETVRFENIKYVKTNGMYYVLVHQGGEMKINRIYSGLKQLKAALGNMGIPME